MQQVDHGPQVAAFLDVHLENIPQVVHGWARSAEHALLLDGSGLRIALGDDDAAESGAVFAGDFLPGGLAFVNAEVHFALFIARLEKNSPAIVGHFHVAELRPAVGFDADGGAQIDFVVVAFVGAHVVPPAHVGGLPMFEGALKDAVAAQVDVIGNFFGVIDHRDLPQ